ncbi:MAG: glycosyltransferase family 2 protein, partial [Rudaea sp.]
MQALQVNRIAVRPADEQVPRPAPLPPSSLIICSRNRPRLLMDTLVSVLSGDQIPDEIIIVDQSDRPDATLDAMESKRGCAIRYNWVETPG